MSDQETLSDKPCGATADWILGYLANECSLDMGCVSPSDFLAVTNAIHNHEIEAPASLRAQVENAVETLKRWRDENDDLRAQLEALRNQLVKAEANLAAMTHALSIVESQHAAARKAMQGACDLLAERTYGNAARSPGHNARLELEAALTDEKNT